MAEVNLELVLKGVTGATDAIKQFSKTATSSLEKVGNTLNNIPVLAIAAALTVAFKKSVDAAIESEESIIALNNALRLTDSFSEAASESFQAYASELEASTAITDEAILSQVAYVKSLGATNDQTTKIVSAATDLSATLGISLDSAVQQLTKTFSGNVGLLGRQIPALKQFTKEQLAAGAAVDFFAEKFAGTAANKVQGFSGQLKLLGITVGNVFEAFGKLVTGSSASVSFLASLTTGFKKVEEIIKTTPEFLQFLFSELSRLGTSIKIFFEEIALTIVETFEKIPLIGDKFKGVSDSIRSSIVENKKFLTTIDDVQDSIFSAANEATKIDKSILSSTKGAKGFGQNIESADESMSKLKDKLKQLDDSLRGRKGNEIKAIQETEKERIQIVRDALDKGLINAAQAAEKRKEIELDAAAKTEDARKKIIEEAAKNPIGSLISGFASGNGDQIAGGGLGLAGAALQGPQGAVTAITSVLGSFAETILPGIGGLVSQIAGVLAQGPEAAVGFVRGFIEAIPTIIENIILAIPAIIDFLNGPDGVVRLIERLIELLPTIAVRFATDLGAQAPTIATKFAIEFIKNIPNMAKEFVTALIDELKKAIGGVFGGIGDVGGSLLGGIGGAISSVGSFFGFAEGGIVPFAPGTGDRVPSMLQPGETVLTENAAETLLSLIKNPPQSSGGSQQSSKQEFHITLQIGEEQLSNVLLTLDRGGFRVTA